MNLNDQIDALDLGVDRLIDAARHAVRSARAAAAQAAQAAPAPADPPALSQPASPAAVEAPAAAQPPEPAESGASTQDAVPAERPTLSVARPSQNEITMSIGGQTVSLNPHQISQLIEELAQARASMSVEQPPALPQGWRFVSTRNPVLAVQKQASGDRLLVARHTGYGWVPFTFSPESAIQLYMLLTQQ
jgi:hypothetical protein